MNEREILTSGIGKTIEYINIDESLEEDGISSCCISFTDGTQINIGCTSYNYGQQDLVIT